MKFVGLTVNVSNNVVCHICFSLNMGLLYLSSSPMATTK